MRELYHSDTYEDSFIFNMFQISKTHERKDIYCFSNNIFVDMRNIRNRSRKLDSTFLLARANYKRLKNVYKRYFKFAKERRHAIISSMYQYIHDDLNKSWLLRGLDFGSNYCMNLDSLSTLTKSNYQEENELEFRKRYRQTHPEEDVMDG